MKINTRQMLIQEGVIDHIKNNAGKYALGAAAAGAVGHYGDVGGAIDNYGSKTGADASFGTKFGNVLGGVKDVASNTGKGLYGDIKDAGTALFGDKPATTTPTTP